MRTARLALAAVAFGLAGSPAIAASSPPTTSAPTDAPWAKDAPAQAFGFAPVTVTQSGVTYAPGDPASTVSTQSAGSLADLPAWAAPPRDKSQAGDVFATLDLRRFGSLPEPAIWALLLTGFAIIGGALRGLILANRRLHRLQVEEEEPEDD